MDNPRTNTMKGSYKNMFEWSSGLGIDRPDQPQSRRSTVKILFLKRVGLVRSDVTKPSLVILFYDKMEVSKS